MLEGAPALDADDADGVACPALLALPLTPDEVGPEVEEGAQERMSRRRKWF